MSLLRVRRAAQLTLPSDVRRALNVKEGDYLEAHVRADGVLLTPVAVVERTRAFAGIRKATAQVRDRKSGKKNALADEKAIAKEVKRMRAAHG
jgi:AbrB family looped-hinge helix DNA binding protein